MFILNVIKQPVKEYLYKILKIPYSNIGVPISLLNHLSKDNPIVLIDIGAYDGSFTLSLEKYCGLKEGILIEPMPNKAKHLTYTFCNPKYQVFNVALSDKSGQEKFEVNDADFTSSLLKIKREMLEFSNINLGSTNTIDCITLTLDDIINQTNIEDIDLIKMDVQGAEHLVLLGGTQSLLKTKMIWTEFSYKALYENSSTFTEIYNMLSKSGFKLIEVENGFRSPDGELLQGDALFINSNFLKSIKK